MAPLLFRIVQDVICDEERESGGEQARVVHGLDECFWRAAASRLTRRDEVSAREDSNLYVVRCANRSRFD